MRTFAQSCDAVKRLVVDPAREPGLDTLMDIVDRGVSREFCVGLSKILKEEAVGEFETRFQWSATLPAPGDLPYAVNIDATAHELVELTAEKLRANKIEPQQVFSGKIVELRRDDGDAYGYIKVSTIRNGRAAEILVRLPADHYDQALGWHRASRPVLVEGQIRSSVGRPLTVRDPRRCHPVDEAFSH